MSAQPGPRNLITDVGGLLVGNAHDERVRTGATVVLAETEAVAAVDIRGGAPGTRETDALDPVSLVDTIHAVTLSGGSVFGLEAAAGVTHLLAERGRGFTFGDQPKPTPVVPGAILFDIRNGGDKDWGDTPPYRALGMAACEAASADFALGNHGAGFGALAGTLKGGLGSASLRWQGATVGALVAVNSFGSALVPGTGRFWAAPFEIGGEFGGLGAAPHCAPHAPLAGTKAEALPDAAGAGQNTTIAVVATDAALTRSEAKRLAIMAADGMARALRPVHTPYDGDLVFALATGRVPLAEPRPLTLGCLGALAADTLARAIARGVYEARTMGPWTGFRDGHAKFPATDA